MQRKSSKHPHGHWLTNQMSHPYPVLKLLPHIPPLTQYTSSSLSLHPYPVYKSFLWKMALLESRELVGRVGSREPKNYERPTVMFKNIYYFYCMCVCHHVHVCAWY